MIEYNEKDFQLGRIRTVAKLKGQTKNPFRVYGLQTEGNPLVHLSYNYDTVIDADVFDENMKKLKDFFKLNRIEFQVEAGGGTPKICIGLRRDLRDHVVLAASILKLIVLSLEDQANLNVDYAVDGIPTFPDAKGKTKPKYRVVAQDPD